MKRSVAAVLHVIYGRVLVDLRHNHDAYTDEYIAAAARGL